MQMLNIEKFLNGLQSKKQSVNMARRLLGYTIEDVSQRYLEIGCGTGVVAAYLSKEYEGEVIGIDIDPKQIALAQKEGAGLPNVHYLEADAAALPFERGSFDVVLSFGVLHHIKNWLDVLKEVKRVLKPGGYFVYADIIYPERITKMDNSSKVSFGLVTVDIDELNSFLEKFGFTNVHSKWDNMIICRNYEAVYRRN